MRQRLQVLGRKNYRRGAASSAGASTKSPRWFGALIKSTMIGDSSSEFPVPSSYQGDGLHPWGGHRTWELIDLEYCQKSFLQDFNRAQLLHPLSYCFSSSLRLGDVVP